MAPWCNAVLRKSVEMSQPIPSGSHRAVLPSALFAGTLGGDLLLMCTAELKQCSACANVEAPSVSKQAPVRWYSSIYWYQQSPDNRQLCSLSLSKHFWLCRTASVTKRHSRTGTRGAGIYRNMMLRSPKSYRSALHQWRKRVLRASLEEAHQKLQSGPL